LRGRPHEWLIGPVDGVIRTKAGCPMPLTSGITKRRRRRIPDSQSGHHAAVRMLEHDLHCARFHLSLLLPPGPRADSATIQLHGSGGNRASVIRSRKRRGRGANAERDRDHTFQWRTATLAAIILHE
jgi:hypothetical protein